MINETSTPEALDLAAHELGYVGNCIASLLADYGSVELAAQAAEGIAYRFRLNGGGRRESLAAIHDEIARRLRA